MLEHLEQRRLYSTATCTEPMQAAAPFGTEHDAVATQFVPPGPRPAFEPSPPMVLTGATLHAIERTRFRASVGSFTVPESLPQTSHLAWRPSIDWGDGTKLTRGHVRPADDGSLSVIGRHRYSLPGQFTVSIVVRLVHNTVPPVAIVGTAAVDAMSGVIFTAAGGMRDARQTVEVRPDGGFTVTGPFPDSPSQEGQLGSQKRAGLAAALVGWSRLRKAYGDVVHDGCRFQVTFAGKQVMAWEPARGDEPATFVDVVRILQSLGDGRQFRDVIPQL
jgi:hypothetical protein